MPGVYDAWCKAEDQIKSVTGARDESYKSWEDAQRTWVRIRIDGWGKVIVPDGSNRPSGIQHTTARRPSGGSQSLSAIEDLRDDGRPPYMWVFRECCHARSATTRLPQLVCSNGRVHGFRWAFTSHRLETCASVDGVDGVQWAIPTRDAAWQAYREAIAEGAVRAVALIGSNSPHPSPSTVNQYHTPAHGAFSTPPKTPARAKAEESTDRE
ncbi:hypothetical protein NMY22_g13868 [Coprinellus aureogranulatus]|nr:hypothetical protein NMY22_g13868 [Coprinellus aureogranulatus]